MINKKKLYESIMKDVSKIVKKQLNEAFYNNKSDIDRVMKEYQYYLDVCSDEDLGRLFDFVGTEDFSMLAMYHLKQVIELCPNLDDIDPVKFIFDRVQETLEADESTVEKLPAFQFANILHKRLTEV